MHSEASPVEHPTREKFRDAMARIAAAVNVITTDGPAGLSGFTATAVCSVSDTPPTLLVCLNRNASVYPTFTTNQKLCVNTLAAGQEEVALLFGKRGVPMEHRFTAESWEHQVSGAPSLIGAVARLDCQIADTVQSGTHDVLFCHVLAAEVDPGAESLVYIDRRFHGIPRIA